MDCPNCAQASRVVDSRGEANRVYRRRECESCGHRFTTYEQLALAPRFGSHARMLGQTMTDLRDKAKRIIDTIDQIEASNA